MKRNSISLYLSGFLLLSSSAFLSAQVVSNYTGWMNDYDGTEAGTRFLFKFDEPSGSNSTPNQAVGGYEVDMFYAADYTARGTPGKFGNAFQSLGPRMSGAAGNVGYAQLAAASNEGLNELLVAPQMSVEIWFRPTSDVPGATGTYSQLLDHKFSSYVGYQLFLDTTGTGLRVQIGNGEKNRLLQAPGLAWEANEWYHLAFTYDGDSGELILYRNGEVLGSNIDPEYGNIAIAQNSSGSNLNLRIGNRLASSFYHLPGSYDNFRVSDVIYQYSTIPEPSTIALIFGIGALALGIIRKRQRN